MRNKYFFRAKIPEGNLFPIQYVRTQQGLTKPKFIPIFAKNPDNKPIRAPTEMTLEEIFDIEAHNQSEIHLFRQGMFYRAFERSCVALRAVERYAVLKKRSAGTGIEYIYSGFPVSVLDRVAAGRGITQVSTDHVILSGHAVSDMELDRLKQATPIALPVVKQKIKEEPPAPIEAKSMAELDFSPNNERYNDQSNPLLELIRQFDLIGASPAACKLFLTMIKMQL